MLDAKQIFSLPFEMLQMASCCKITVGLYSNAYMSQFVVRFQSPLIYLYVEMQGTFVPLIRVPLDLPAIPWTTAISVCCQWKKIANIVRISYSICFS